MSHEVNNLLPLTHITNLRSASSTTNLTFSSVISDTLNTGSRAYGMMAGAGEREREVDGTCAFQPRARLAWVGVA